MIGSRAERGDGVTMCWEGRQTYPAMTGTPRLARTYCTDALLALFGRPGAERLIDDAELVVSELVTNALNAHAAQVQLHITVHRDHLRLAVEDDAAGAPQLVHAENTDEHGRGLAIVEAVAEGWGIRDSGLGKQVWADLAVPLELTRTLECSPSS